MSEPFDTMIKKIVSGGQTGADQAALDTAIELSIPYKIDPENLHKRMGVLHYNIF